QGEGAGKALARAPEHEAGRAAHAVHRRRDRADDLPAVPDRQLDTHDIAVVRGGEAQTHRLAAPAEARQHAHVRAQDIRTRRGDQLPAPVRRDPAVLDVDPLELLLAVVRVGDDRDVEAPGPKLAAGAVVAPVEAL